MRTGECAEGKIFDRISKTFLGLSAALLLSGLAAAQTPFRIDFARGTAPALDLLKELGAGPAPIPDIPQPQPERAPDPAPIAVPALPAGTNKNFVKPFNAGIVNAVRRLRAPGCAAFFGEGAEARFLNTSYRFVPMGAPAVDEHGSVKVTGAATFHAPDAVLINSQGPFLSPMMYVSGKNGFQVVDMGTNLRGADFSALLLLHELGHIVHKFGPDAADPELNLSNTRTVLKNCF